MLDLICLLPPLVFAVVVHEVSHGYVAYRLGDSTAKEMGRLTLNPIKHVSLFGTVLLPLFLVLVHAPFLFAWAKPVPVNPVHFRRPLKDMGWVAIAGPVSNFLMASVFALLFRLGTVVFGGNLPAVFVLVCQYGVIINVVLGTFNLLPIPPLDGGRIATALLPMQAVRVYARLERVGILLVIALLYLGGLQWIMTPISKIVALFLGEPVRFS